MHDTTSPNPFDVGAGLGAAGEAQSSGRQGRRELGPECHQGGTGSACSIPYIMLCILSSFLFYAASRVLANPNPLVSTSQLLEVAIAADGASRTSFLFSFVQIHVVSLGR